MTESEDECVLAITVDSNTRCCSLETLLVS